MSFTFLVAWFFFLFVISHNVKVICDLFFLFSFYSSLEFLNCIDPHTDLCAFYLFISVLLLFLYSLFDVSAVLTESQIVICMIGYRFNINLFSLRFGFTQFTYTCILLTIYVMMMMIRQKKKLMMKNDMEIWGTWVWFCCSKKITRMHQVAFHLDRFLHTKASRIHVCMRACERESSTIYVLLLF